jgi:hypothetical protein
LAQESEYCPKEESKNDSISNPQTVNSKKPFIEPEISPAVDVLEATTFFQTADSGVTP